MKEIRAWTNMLSQCLIGMLVCCLAMGCGIYISGARHKPDVQPPKLPKKLSEASPAFQIFGKSTSSYSN